MKRSRILLNVGVIRTTLSRVGGIAVAFVTASAIIFGIAAPAAAQNVGLVLLRDERLYPDDYIEITWPGGTYWLIMQLDANLVLYKGDRNHNVTKVCWASNTSGRGWNATYAIYQWDGNFVIYSYSGFPIWDSNTVAYSGTSVDVSGKGRLYVGTKQLTGNC